MSREHSISCEFPEGCSCGASVFNALEKQANELEKQVGQMRRALAFCDGVFMIIEDHRFTFNMDGVKEARRRIGEHFP